MSSVHPWSTSSALATRVRFTVTRTPIKGVPWEPENLGIVNANRNALLGDRALIGGYNNEISYTGDGGPYLVPQHDYQYTDSLSCSKKQYTFKFGA